MREPLYTLKLITRKYSLLLPCSIRFDSTSSNEGSLKIVRDPLPVHLVRYILISKMYMLLLSCSI